MPEYSLLNLFLGWGVPSSRSGQHPIGPFCVKPVEAYASAVKTLTQRSQVQIRWVTDESGELQEEVIRIPAVVGDWAVTAIATLVSEDEKQTSVLGRDPINDGGLFDLCEILTFVTGRRVTVEPYADRYNPKNKGDHFCPPQETLAVARHIWERRDLLVTKKIQYAILSHNKAFDSSALQDLAANYNTALNVLVDQWPHKENESIAKDLRERLREEVKQVVDLMGDLTVDQKEAYKALLGSRIMQGTESLMDHLVRVTVDLGLVSNPPSPAERQRIKFVNAVRNRLTHSGQIPDLAGVSREQSDRYTFAIVCGVVPELVRLATAHLLDFDPDRIPWLADEKKVLRRFFAEGVWRDWPLELTDVDTWIAQLTLDVFFNEATEM